MSGTPRAELSVYGAEHAYPPFLAEGRGRCATDLWPDDFTNDGIGQADAMARERARRVCLRCPFRLRCAEWAIATVQQGVYGATTTQDRREIRERRSQAA